MGTLDKREHLVATVDYRDRCFLAWMESRLAGAEPGREALNALYRALDDWFNGRDESIQPFHGCFFINVSADLGAALKASKVAERVLDALTA